MNPGDVRGCGISFEWQLALRGLSADISCRGRSRLHVQAGRGHRLQQERNSLTPKSFVRGQVDKVISGTRQMFWKHGGS